MLVPNTLQGVMPDAQIELANEPAGAEGRQGFAEFHQLCLAGSRSFVRLTVTCTRPFLEAGRAVLLEAAQPLAHRGDGGGEEPRGGFDAALPGALDQTKAMVVSVFHLTYQIEIADAGGHGAAILCAKPRWTTVEKAPAQPAAWESRRRRGIPTFPQSQQQRLHLLPAPAAHTLQTSQGDTM